MRTLLELNMTSINGPKNVQEAEFLLKSQCSVKHFRFIRESYPLFPNPDKSGYNSNGCTASITLRNASSFQCDAALEGGTTQLSCNNAVATKSSGERGEPRLLGFARNLWR